MRGERWRVGFVLTALFAALAVRADQPIVENYVGRQIPTAMVARNLDRGSGFLNPTLDTAPFPNRFLVEPPIYAQMVAWARAGIGFVSSLAGSATGSHGWEVAGRLTSATMTVLGAWAFWGLVRRREGSAVAILALASFCLFPVTLRFGRAVQPDATMLGFVLLGMRAWDEFQATGRERFALVGGFVFSLGLATKVTSAWSLIPFFLVATRWPASSRLGAMGLMLLPAASWYAYAWGAIRSGAAGEPGVAGSLASADNAAIWLRTIAPTSWLRLSTWRDVAMNLGVRAFTPMAFVLIAAGWLVGRTRPRAERLGFPGGFRPWDLGDPLWRGWAVGVGLAIVALAAKWHHLYYWLALAPLIAVAVGRAAVFFGKFAPGNPALLCLPVALFALTCLTQSRSTWRTPPEWASIRAAAERIGGFVPAGSTSLLIAPEAVLFYVDRPGLRLEFSPEAMRRASGEWGTPIAVDRANSDPLALVDFYRGRENLGDPAIRFGPAYPRNKAVFVAGFVADVGSVAGDARRAAFRDAIRRRPDCRILIDEPELILAALGGRP